MAHPVCNFKLVLLGDSGVGKSCLVLKFVRGEYFQDNPPTLGGIDIFLFKLLLFLKLLNCQKLQ